MPGIVTKSAMFQLTIVFLSALTVASAGTPRRLFQVLDNVDTSNIIDCHMGEPISCKKVWQIFRPENSNNALSLTMQINIDFDAFRTADSLLMTDSSIELRRHTHHAEEEESQHEGHMAKSFESSDLSASSVLTFTDASGFPELTGYVSYSDAASYTIHSCGRDCHVLVHQNSTQSGVIEPPESEGFFENERLLSPKVEIMYM